MNYEIDFKPCAVASSTEKMPTNKPEKPMLKLHPEILMKNGKKEFVVLPYEEYIAMQEQLADAQDLLELRKAKRSESKKKSLTLVEVKRALGIR